VTQLQAIAEKIDRLAEKLEAQVVQPMNVDRAAEYLSISKSYLYSLTSRREIPHFKTAGGKQLTFLKADMDKWLTAHPVHTREEIRQQVAEAAEK
jgi:excisionase family DNA binding protein